MPAEQRIKLSHLGENFYTIVAEDGFMQYPNVPRVLPRCSGDGLTCDLMDTSCFVGRIKIVPAKQSAKPRDRIGQSDRDLTAGP